MEKVSIGDLPKGSIIKLKKQAKKDGFLKKNGAPHLGAWAKSVLLGALK